MKTRRQARYQKLRECALAKFEARPLSRVSFRTCPYIKEIMRDRLRMFKQAKAEGLTQRQWEDKIKGLYRGKGWTKTDKLGRTIADPYKMFRHYEDTFKAKQPQYESPWQPRGKKFKDFIRYMDGVLDVQHGRRRYIEAP